MTQFDFSEYTLPAPTFESIAVEYEQITQALEAAGSGDEAIAAVESWDALRRRLWTWTSLVNIRFHQDTRNKEYKKNREYADELDPKLTDLAVALKRRLLSSRHRDSVAGRFGRHAFDLWECDVASFDSAIKEDLVRQSRLDAEYTELLASPKFEFRGESLTLSELNKFAEHPQRDVRHDAARLRWNWFGEHRKKLDSIYDDLVRLRQQMAQKLGYENFIPVAYKWMQRTDYDQRDVEQFRGEVRQHVVPLAVEIRRAQAETLGVDPLMAWDEGLHDPAGNPQPLGDHDWMVDRATEMFDALGPPMDDFFGNLRDQQLMDLKSRSGKAGGGFCDSLPLAGMPFIFANFNGTKGDVEVFTHEMGHAFQNFSSQNQPLADYLWPTSEACEIHSMGLEFLTWPQMELFFGDDAQRFRRLHLKQSLLFLPYGVAVDHFQHLVYAEPHASPDDRAAMWLEMEQTYLPWRNWGDLAHPATGRRWQAQPHIFGAPFYYIDYTLALTCAMQLWAQAQDDPAKTLATYLDLCRRGGEAPFRQLTESAGLTSPFVEGCLSKIVARAKNMLDRE